MPRPRKDTAESRSHYSLEPTANRHPSTNKRPLGCFEDFTHWINEELGIYLDEDQFPPKLMNEALIGYGKHLFYEGYPKYTFLPKPSMQ